MNQKKPEDLQLHEAARLLEYKMYQLNLSELAQKVNINYQNLLKMIVILLIIKQQLHQLQLKYKRYQQVLKKQ